MKIQCEATTKPAYWWNDNLIEYPQCKHNASVEIDGIKLCLQHAGTIAVIKLLHLGLAKKLPNIPQTSPLCEIDNPTWRQRL